MSQLQSKRVEYANSFMLYFREQFDQEQGDFFITIKEFDDWLIQNQIVDDPETDNPKSAEWIQFVSKRNKVRLEMNAAASMGKHGEPPFSVDTSRAHRKKYIVRCLYSMAVISPRELAQHVLSLVETKYKRYKYMSEFLETREDLPPYLRMQVKTHKRMFNSAMATSRVALAEYIEAVVEDYEEAVKLLGEEAPNTPQLTLIE
jgi:hypothetical protein